MFHTVTASPFVRLKLVSYKTITERESYKSCLRDEAKIKEIPWNHSTANCIGFS